MKQWLSAIAVHVIAVLGKFVVQLDRFTDWFTGLFSVSYPDLERPRHEVSDYLVDTYRLRGNVVVYNPNEHTAQSIADAVSRYVERRRTQEERAREFLMNYEGPWRWEVGQAQAATVPEAHLQAQTPSEEIDAHSLQNLRRSANIELLNALEEEYRRAATRHECIRGYGFDTHVQALGSHTYRYQIHTYRPLRRDGTFEFTDTYLRQVAYALNCRTELALEAMLVFIDQRGQIPVLPLNRHIWGYRKDDVQRNYWAYLVSGIVPNASQGPLQLGHPDSI